MEEMAWLKERLDKSFGLDYPTYSDETFVSERFWWALSCLINNAAPETKAPYEFMDALDDMDPGDLWYANVFPLASQCYEEACRYFESSPNWETDVTRCGFYELFDDLPPVGYDVFDEEFEARVRACLPEIIGETARDALMDELGGEFDVSEYNESAMFFFVSKRLGTIHDAAKNEAECRAWQVTLLLIDEFAECFDQSVVTWGEGKLVIAVCAESYTDCGFCFRTPNAACLILPHMIDKMADAAEAEIKKCGAMIPRKEIA
jgi:hypothetical protein